MQCLNAALDRLAEMRLNMPQPEAPTLIHLQPPEHPLNRQLEWML